MSSIDTRVVEAKFDNRQFQEGVKGTLNSLDSLKRGLNMDGATNGLTGLASATQRVSNGLNVMRVAAYTAIATIAHQATIAGEQLVKSFTVGPLIDGLHEYETQLNSVQTILSNTQWEHKNLKDVNGALNELNHYSDKTIYNFSEMARNVGTFTAAGVGLDKSVASIKGIANLAAVSGSNSQQAATAMYQLSQAISSGTVKLMDWNSVVNAGMGGKVFQDALKETARVHGVNIDHMIKKEGSFRNTLQNGWLTSKILTQTLNNFTGDVSKKQLEQMGYTEKQIQGILKMGKTATDAATKVKTFTQLMGTLKEAAGSGWAKTWQIIIGNFNQAKEVWTNVSNVLGGAIQSSAKARNNMLKDWAAFGGRQAMIDGISNAFKALMSVLKPIKDAFREIFPAKTGQQLADMTKSFRDFMANLKIGADTADALKRTFAGVFAVLDIGWQVIKAGIGFIADLFGAITKGEGSGGFLGATANLGDWLVALDQAIKKGQGLTKFFHGLEHVLAGPIQLLKNLAHAIFSVFDFGGGKADPEKITKAFSPLESFGHALITIWDKLGGVLGKVWSVAKNIGEKIVNAFSAIGEALTGAFGNINYDSVLHTINTVLLGGIVLLIKKFVDHFTKGGSNPLSGFVDSIKAPFGELTGTLKQMQSTLRATTLLQIAAAIGIMTASVIGLAQVNTEQLTRALTAMSVMFGQLFASILVFQKIGGASGLTATATGLIVFATAIRIMTSSVRALSELSWGELAKGIVGVTALIGGLVLAVRGMSGQAGGMIRAGAGLLILSAGIKVLVSAVTDLSGLSWGQMAKGLTGVAALLVALGLFTKFAGANAGGILQSAGIVLLAAAIKILASAVADFAKISWGGIAKGLASITAILIVFSAFSKSVGQPFTLLASGAALIMIGAAMNILAKAIQSFAKMSWGQLAKGLVALAGALAIIVVALQSIESAIGGAAALLIVAAALRVLAPVLTTFGDMDWGQIAKAMVTLAGALVIILLGVAGMEEALPGAAALLVVAGALRILTPVLTTLGSMSWTQIAKGLVTLAGAFAVIGLAGLVLTPVIPSILGLAGAIALLGVAVLAIGAGVFLFATGLTALAAAGAAATGAVVGIVKGLIDLLPLVAKSIGASVVAFATVIAKAGPAITKAITAVLDALINAIRRESPKIISTFAKILVDLADALSRAVPKIAAAALRMMLGVLNAVADNAPKVVRTIARMITNMLEALASKVPDMVKAAVDLIVAFLDGIANNLDRIIQAGVHIVAKLIKGIGKAALDLVDAAAKTVLKFLHGLADAIRKYEPQFMAAGWDIAKAIAEGFWQGLRHGLGGMFGKVADMFGGVTSVAYDVLDAHSPSRVFWRLGMWSAVGFANGIRDFGHVAKDAAKDMVAGSLQDMTKEFRDAAKYVLKDLPKGLVGGKDEVKQTIQDTQGLLHNAAQQSHQDVQQLKQDLKDLKNSRKDDDKAVRDATEGVDDARKKLVELQNAKKQDHQANVQAARDLRDAKEQLVAAVQTRKDHEKAIKDDTTALAKATNEHDRAKAALDAFNATIDKHKEKLVDLGKQYDTYTAKIDAANQALNDAIQTRDSYTQSITDQYSTLPDITPDTDLAQYEGSLQTQINDTITYADVLKQLRDQFHLNDDVYKQLLAKGPDVLPFAEQILTGGQDAVDMLNGLAVQLDSTAKALGLTASTALYQAGVDAAQGIVNGLEKKRHDIVVKMEAIADDIQTTIKKKLKIKSPSQVMHDLGTKMMDGLGNGIKDSKPELVRIVDDIGQTIVRTMQHYVTQANTIAGNVSTPSVTPVVTSGAKTAVKSTTAPKTPAVSPATSTATASNVSFNFGNLAAIKDAIASAQTPVQPNLTFNQTNNSPKALSAAEIYRQTQNQISVAKGALTK